MERAQVNRGHPRPGAGHHGSRGATCVTTVAGAPARKDGTSVTHRFPALIAAPATARGRLWLTGARLFDGTVDGTGAPLRPNTAILVEDGVIRRVADDRERCPDGARPVDLGRRGLQPGRAPAPHPRYRRDPPPDHAATRPP